MLPIETTTPPTTGQNSLEEAFTRFTEASERLQVKYDALRHEVEELRAELERKNEAIKRAERLAALGQTAAAMAHEVRNPLGAIELFVSLLADNVSDRRESREYIAQIRHSIDRLNTTVTNILHFAADRQLERVPCNLHAIVHECVSALPIQSGRAGPVELVLDANPFLDGNAVGLRQVMTNLITNSLQATRYSGRVVVETANGEDEEIILRVWDDGGGIPAEILPTVFEPFVTSKNEGTGLGLAIVKQIVSQHDGRVTASNRPEGGAQFEVVLPRRAFR